MTLLRLRLEAFGPFAEIQDIDFSVGARAGLFLIHGPTGSGKTSLLDALCFALYGASSGDERKAGDLRSHHAGDDQGTVVTLDFALQEHHYRIRRWMTARRVVNFAEKAVIEETSPSPRILADRRAEVNSRIQDLLRLDAGQFRQVIVLPQGRFRDFLVASSQARETILQSLFQTGRLGDFIERLGQRRQQAAEDLKQLADRADMILQGLGASGEDGLDAFLTGLAVQRDASLLERDRLRLGARDSRRNLLQAQADAHQFQALHQARRDCGRLEAESPSRAEQEIQLAEARAMAGINSLHERQASLETDLAATRADHRKVELLQDDAVNQAEVFQAVLNGLEPRRQAMPQRQALLNRRLAMREALSGLEELARQRDRLLAETAQREQALEERTAAGKAMAGRLESGRRDREAELSWALAGSTVESLLGLLDRLHELGNRLHQRSGQEERLAQQVQRQTDELASLVREEAGLRTELADAEVRERLDRAATLAATLSEGHPCPVCGSPHHPAPARKAGGEHDPDHRDQWHRRVEELAGLRQAMGIQHGVDQSHLERLGGEIRECRQSMLALRQEILDSIASRDNGGTSLPPDIAACLAAARALAAAPFPERSEWPELARLRESAGQLVRRCQAAGRSVSQLDKQLEALEKGLAEQDQARQSARDESAAWRERLGACENRLAEEGRRLAGEFGQNGQEPPRREQLELQISGDQAWLERSALEWQQAEASLAEQRGRQAVAAGRLADLDARLSSLQDMADQAKAAWQDAFRAAGFADASQALSRLMPAARLAALESGLAAYKQDLALARNRRAELEAALAGRTEADLARLERECQEQENALAEAEAGCARLEHALGHATAQAAELRALRGAQGQRQASLDSLGALFRLVSGQEAAGGYVNLPRYALSVYLDEILLVANQYLREMTRGRYELVREDQTVGKKRTGGLELYVSDTVTGVRRGTESLSGGESFMTALSLALGLSSVVHARSGGVRLDTLFVDEGFGSLDEDSLEDAMRVLGRIHERGRVIGIISHVRELQERIACRLVVDKGPAGSGAAWSR